jgi:hypothetical protein
MIWVCRVIEDAKHAGVFAIFHRACEVQYHGFCTVHAAAADDVQYLHDGVP